MTFTFNHPWEASTCFAFACFVFAVLCGAGFALWRYRQNNIKRRKAMEDGIRLRCEDIVIGQDYTIGGATRNGKPRRVNDKS